MITLYIILFITLTCMILGSIDWNYKAPRTHYYNVKNQQGQFTKIDQVEYYGHLIINK